MSSPPSNTSPETMPSPSPPLATETATVPSSYNKTLHNLSLACLVVCPLLIALPPRRLDLFTGSLGAGTLLSANHLHRERYGVSIGGRLAGQTAPVPGTEEEEEVKRPSLTSLEDVPLPTERAREFQRRWREQQELLKKSTGEPVEEKKRGLGERLWYGDEEPDGWKEKRDREIQEKFEQGKGIGDVIVDQIWEVWNWGRGGSGKEA